MPIELKIPEVGESISEVQIGEWLKVEGDSVAKDENVVTVESEKATVDLPAPAAGVLKKILKQKGATVKPGEVIAQFEEVAPKAAAATKRAEKPVKEVKKKARAPAKAPEETPEKAPPAAERAEPAQPAPKAKPPPTEGDGEAEEEKAAKVETQTRVMPAAQRLLAEHGLRAEDVKATGPGGRLLKEDVLRHVERGQAAPAPAPPAREPPAPAPAPAGARAEEVVPMSPLRRTVARRLVEAQHNAALLTTINEIDMSAVQALRKECQESFQQKHGIKLGLMSFFVKAVVESLKQFPQLNAEVRGTDIVYHNYYDIGIAIGSGKGLVVPVLRQTERLSFAEVEKAIADFARRAQENKLRPEELQGGTFTISNGGVYGSLLSTPIVNPPQSGVLGMHAIQDRPVAVEGNVVIRPMMYVALTYDHRIVDGREAVTFLRRVKEVIEKPARMLIEA
jgi:2-oxoglutarate dehydrogenase E2 component (dihydrolipoamide succinyltransferase)